MSGKIVILPESLSHRIAAGEVIERPASILKELLENSLDASATQIHIELAKGGCGMIRVTDNGEGLAPEDVPKAFERYATSKIYEFEDIYKVGTFGFRGEALPSIASIARVEMITRMRGNPFGVKMTVNAGRVEEMIEIGCPEGTTVTVTEIFDAVPVRKKFLKAEATEQGCCIDVVARTAPAYPHVRIHVGVHGRTILQIPATEDFSQRVALILGVDIMDHLMPVQAASGALRLRGFISRPPFARSQSKHIFNFVNGRYIRDYLLNHAVMTAYRNIIEARRYPAVVLLLDVPPGDVDVNVHPAKLEVRFRNPREVYAMVAETLTQALAQLAPQAKTLQFPEAGGLQQSVNYLERVEEAMRRYRLSSPTQKLSFTDSIAQQRREAVALEAGRDNAHGPLTATSAEEHAPLFGNLDYLGQFAQTYLVFSTPQQLVLLDQHAAHERIMFEKFKRKKTSRTVGQQLLIPEVITLAPRDAAFLQDSLPFLESVGIEAAIFGEDAVIVRSVPAECSHVDARALISDMLDSFSDQERLLALDERKEKFIRILACKAAVTANRSLSPAEVQALCDDLDKTPSAATCPHGRPVYITLGLNEMEKRFKRK